MIEINRCYICGRTDKDFKFLHDNVRTHFEAGVTRAINSLNTRERRYNEEYGKAIELLEGIDPQNRDLSPRTVKTDIAAFSKRIPGIKEILAECEKLPGYRDRFKFAELLDKAKAGDGRVASGRNEVQSAKQKRDAYEEHQMYVYSLKLGSLFRGLGLPPWRKDDDYIPVESTKIDVPLCIVCNALIEHIGISPIWWTRFRHDGKRRQE